jgi:sulfatase modifying factor 1
MATAHSHFKPEPASPIEPNLVLIPAAWFLMGSASGQDCERPVHRVWIDTFLLAATQVTNAEYQHYVNSTSSDPPPFSHDQNFNHPQQSVTGVSWFDADRYAQWLAAQTGRLYRLPTEA